MDRPLLSKYRAFFCIQVGSSLNLNPNIGHVFPSVSFLMVRMSLPSVRMYYTPLPDSVFPVQAIVALTNLELLPYFPWDYRHFNDDRKDGKSTSVR
jgi:hypothetical protein